MTPLRIAVVGTVGSDPYAGMAWMTMQIAAGFLRLGHDVRYCEVTSRWPYDPVRGRKVLDSDYTVSYLARVAELFGLADRWAYMRTYSDRQWLGPNAAGAATFLATADLVFNIAGATNFAKNNIAVGRAIWLATDPVFQEVWYAAGDPYFRHLINQHESIVTYGENIGSSGCIVPPLPRLRARTRQPVLLDMWTPGPPARDMFTTVGNWRQDGRDIEFNGQTYRWSKHHEFLKFLSLPQRTSQAIEFATNLTPSRAIAHKDTQEVTALGFVKGEYERLVRYGWHLVDGPSISMDPRPYRDYILASRGEFTVARDLNIRLASGWFSERSACYLAAGRPVVTQDTGFGCSLPVGEGLFAVKTIEDAVTAIETINADYERHSKAARDIAQQFFRAETVLAKLLEDLA